MFQYFTGTYVYHLTINLLKNCLDKTGHYRARGEEKQEYIRFNKKNQTYTWVDQPKGYDLDEKIYWLKKLTTSKKEVFMERS